LIFTHLPEMQRLPDGQSPQLSILFPQPSAAWPHSMPCAPQLCGVQLSGTHLPAIHELLAGQAGQVIELPHSSPA
jgi:hypothetical protein